MTLNISHLGFFLLIKLPHKIVLACNPGRLFATPGKICSASLRVCFSLPGDVPDKESGSING